MDSISCSNCGRLAPVGARSCAGCQADLAPNAYAAPAAVIAPQVPSFEEPPSEARIAANDKELWPAIFMAAFGGLRGGGTVSLGVLGVVAGILSWTLRKSPRANHPFFTGLTALAGQVAGLTFLVILDMVHGKLPEGASPAFVVFARLFEIAPILLTAGAWFWLGQRPGAFVAAATIAVELVVLAGTGLVMAFMPAGKLKWEVATALFVAGYVAVLVGMNWWKARKEGTLA